MSKVHKGHGKEKNKKGDKNVPSRRVQKVVIALLTINRTPLIQSDLSSFASLMITELIYDTCLIY